MSRRRSGEAQLTYAKLVAKVEAAAAHNPSLLLTSVWLRSDECHAETAAWHRERTKKRAKEQYARRKKATLAED